MAAKKRTTRVDDEEEIDPEIEVETEQEDDTEVEPDAEAGETESSSAGVSFEMGRMYIAGVDDEDEESDGPVNVDDYEEMDDSADLKKAREMIAGGGTDDDSGMSTAEEDPFLENVDYDPSEEWVLGD